MRQRLILPVVAAAAAFLAGCSEKPPPPSGAASAPLPAAADVKPPVRDAGKNLIDPADPLFQKPAPDVYRVRFTTTKGEFDVTVRRAWAPRGADRFYGLARSGFLNDLRFFRVVPDFMAQFGIHGDPKVSERWTRATILDDPVKQGNTRGRISFAMSGPNSRTTQLFINFVDNAAKLDGQGFAAFGEVTEGMETVDAINAEYRESPDQGQIQRAGNEYLDREFPKLDRIKSARVLEP